MRRAAGSSLLLVPLLLTACTSEEQDDAVPGLSPAPGASATTDGSPTAAAATLAPPVAPADVPPLVCPAVVPPVAGDPWVPAPPSTATEGRLVPDADPVEALVCRYGPAGPGGARLEGEQLITTGLERLRLDLDVRAGARPPCPASPPAVPHLARLTYADGDLWLAAAEGCDGAGNGQFVTPAPVGERLAEAFATGAWPSAPAR